MRLTSITTRWTMHTVFAAVSALALCRPAIAASRVDAIASPQEDSAASSSRVVAPIDENRLVRLVGNTHPRARAEFDQGAADPQRMMDRIMLVLRRSPEQEAALDRFMAEQYDPKSANFHRWLEPEEFGRVYGLSDADLGAVTSWLENHGFQILTVAKGRDVIEFSGTVGQVQQAFHTEIHRFLVDGKEHIANVSDPSIPAALAPAIVGPAALHDFIPTHQSVLGGLVKRDRKTGVVTPLDESHGGVTPQLTYEGPGSHPHEDITPYDFATIYNLLPLWNAGIGGSDVKIAIAGVSDIEQSDLDTFRSGFGLPAMTLETIHNGPDPGIVPGGTVENTADVEWSGAAAKNAQIVLVVTASAPGSSMEYIVDNKVAPIMSGSYGECESELGTAGNAAFNAVYQKGAAAGISIFISSGDQGATGCDKSGQAGPYYATQGLQVNGLASSPYVTGVGGTDFNWFVNSNLSTYWNASQNSDGATAKGYIPELPWDPTCTSQWLLTNYHYSDALTLCGDAVGSIGGALDPLVFVEGGSGGRSSCTTNSGSTPETCGGGYAKPSWQAGTGVPNDGKRDVPDVSLFAAGGWPQISADLDGSAYLICLAAASPGGCDYSDPSYIIYQEIGGTSLSSPAMAGIMAMVVQKMDGKWQGLANPVLYQLAGKENYSNCGSDSVAAGNQCVFYDITDGSNAMVCQTDSVDCYNPSGLGPIGISTGYNSGPGYDQTTGLGSVNAKNLVYGWAAAIAPDASLSTSKLTFASTKIGSSSAAQVLTLKNTGLTTLDISSGGITIAGADASSFLKTTTCAATLAPGASCNAKVTFKPVASGTLTATLEIADNATGSPQKVALVGTGASAAAIVLTPATLSFPNTATGTTSSAQTVTVANSTSTAVAIKSIAIKGTDPKSFVQENNCGASLAAKASCTVIVAFKPASAASQTATLSVSDNASGSPQTVPLSGTGTAQPAVKLSAKSLAFPSTAEGASAKEQSVTLTNAGATALDITAITLAGTNASSFSQLNTCPATLAPAANCVIYVDFSPAATGALTASVSIADNGGAAPQTVNLVGTGSN